jgi:hypothetical protein
MIISPLRKLDELGQSVWMDFLRRGIIRAGELGRLIEEDDDVDKFIKPYDQLLKKLDS